MQKFSVQRKMPRSPPSVPAMVAASMGFVEPDQGSTTYTFPYAKNMSHSVGGGSIPIITKNG